jgi:flagellar motor switch protein FliN/FliY
MTDENDLKPEAAEDAKMNGVTPEDGPGATPGGSSSGEAPESPGEEVKGTPDSGTGAMPAGSDSAPAAVAEEGNPAPVDKQDASEENAEADVLKMLDDLPEEDSGASADDIDFGSAEVSRAEFQQLSQPVADGTQRNIDLLMDVDLPVSIELGRAKMSIADILSLGPGSVVELNKLAGEPVDLLVNHKIVARGEVVVVDENFGLRVTQLMTPEERLRLLGKE